MAIKNKKGSGHTEELSKELMAQLNCDTAFTIPLFGGIPVAESVVVTWVIMAVLLIAAAILGRNLKVENVGKKQLVLETIVEVSITSSMIFLARRENSISHI